MHTPNTGQYVYFLVPMHNSVNYIFFIFLRSINHANQGFRLSMDGEWRHLPWEPAVGSVHIAHLHLNP